MKKGLLLSVVASGFIFAGGNIAPVEPVHTVQPTVAPAACDFWGQIGARYEFKDSGKDGEKFADKDNNTWKTAVILGVEKDLGYGFGIGAEIAGISQLGLNIAKKKDESAEISELYLTYKNGNTAIKLGRQALPKSLSPWAWTDDSLGVKENTFEGIVAVNTDLKDTTLVGAWIAKAGTGSSFSHVNGVNNKGLFMLAAQNKSLANTTLTGSLYYVTESKITSAWFSAKTKVSGVKLGAQVAYAKESEKDATTGVAAYIGSNFSGLDAKLTLSYLKSGDTTLAFGGTSGFWGNSVGGAIDGDIMSNDSKQTIAALSFGYKIDGYGKVYSDIAYNKVSDDKKIDKQIAARVGYKFNIGKVKAKIEYRYAKTDNLDGTSSKKQRVRIQGVYKF